MKSETVFLSLKEKHQQTLTSGQRKDMQAYVMKKTGCSRATYWRYLSGRSKDQNIGLAIAAFLKSPLEDVLKLERSPEL